MYEMATSTTSADDPTTLQDSLADILPQEESSITELQVVFGSMLVASKSKDDTSSPDTPGPPPWTAAFRLFDLPRELRDLIYYHYLYHPSGYRHITRANWCVWYSPASPSRDVQNLFLVSRTVYAESLAAFCRYNVLAFRERTVPKRGQRLEGKLRLFPDRHARCLTRLLNVYEDEPVREPNLFPLPSDEHFYHPGQTFVDIVRDAHAFRHYFPKLRELTARWYSSQQIMADSRLWFAPQKSEEEENVEMWVRSMKDWLKKENVKPASWLTFELWDRFVDTTKNMEMQQEGPFNEAYRKLVKEWKDEDIEDSGKIWLEEMGADGARKKGRARR
jgi:hypothetical protein